MKSSIFEMPIYEQCQRYFKNQTDKIIAETVEEVEEYLAKIRKKRFWVTLGLGLLSLVPLVGIAAGIGNLFGQTALNSEESNAGYDKSADVAASTIALSKYEPGKITFSLCFGVVEIPLKSKITISKLSHQ